MSHIYGAMGEVALDDVSARLVGMLAANMTRVIDLFREWDLNGDGMISPKEFRRAMREIGYAVPREHVDLVFESMDPDGSGQIEYKELSKLLRHAGPALRARHVTSYELRVTSYRRHAGMIHAGASWREEGPARGFWRSLCGL